ncbi:hypothetical protein BJV77DRAFT_980551 [Russula vinacea]|nr:hypothetical protein BJV77DRAFT_980551 [Russula vinacea]
MGSQISTNLTLSLPYPTFHPSASDRRVNIIWLISLVCSLSAALLATLIQQWVRAYMRIFQQSSNPLKTARTRLFLFEGAERLPVVAEAVPGLIHVPLIIFFWGLGDTIMHIDTAVLIATVVPIGICACLYFYCAITPIWNPQSSYRTQFQASFGTSSENCVAIFIIIVSVAKWPNLRVWKYVRKSAMKETETRKKRDVRAIQWLVDNINGSKETLRIGNPGLIQQPGVGARCLEGGSKRPVDVHCC